jgi:hypothetical protein
MATLKNPSIYDDRSTIGSADELDEYGVWVKIEPEELSDATADQFPDFDADFGPEITLDETLEDDAAFESLTFSGGGEDSGFDDVEALRQDIQAAAPDEAGDAIPAGSALAYPAGTEPAAALPAASPLEEPIADSADLSTRLLMKIADELSSIKVELSTLKGELSAIRSEKPLRGAGGEAEDAGFFDEEDDDKIALTGDELNNIIHTADFTEETGFDAGASLSDDFAPDAPSEAPARPSPSGDDEAAIIYDGLGRPLRAPAQGDAGDSGPAAPASAPVEADSEAAGGEIIYDGLGRPLNRSIAGEEGIDASLDASLALKDSDDLKALRENGVEPMTSPPEDTSYLEEDPLVEGDSLVEEDLDLSDAVIDEPDLSEGVQDTPLEEPSLDSLSLIDLETITEGGEKPGADDEAVVEEKPFFEDITFEDLPDSESPSEGMMDIENLDDAETIDLSIFEDDFSLDNADGSEGSADAGSGDLSFEVLDEDADLPVQQNLQDNVISEDSFEPISLDDDGEIDLVTFDEDLEQSLSGDMKIELEDLPPLELPSSGEDDENFSLPGSADTADAGDQTITITEVPPAVRMELKDVLVYMDKLLESLPEEKINEFAQSEHYTTYRKLFEELGIQQ